MALFAPAKMQTAFLKMGVYGGAGSGKSFTSSLIAIGLAKYVHKKTGRLPAVNWLDTEKGLDWLIPTFEKACVPLNEARTRAFTDLKTAVTETEKTGDILVIDSTSHFWKELGDSLLQAKRERLNKKFVRMEMNDIGDLKAQWSTFTESYLSSSAHIIACGRSGGVYEFYEDEDGKKSMLEVGTKMAAERTFAHEPSLIIEMFADQVKTALKGKRQKKVMNRALVLKDRSDLLNGLEFIKPEFKNFLPHIERLNIGGVHAAVNGESNSSALFSKERDEKRHDRAIILEEIDGLLERHGHSGTSKEARATRADLILRHFKTVSKTEIEKKISTDELRRSYNDMHVELEGVPSRYFPTEEEVEDAIPFLDEPKADAEAASEVAPVDELPDDKSAKLEKTRQTVRQIEGARI